jgi:SAM-dependent methyltransferase
MHQSVHDWAARTIRPEWVKGARVLEVGSLDVNGSLRDAVKAMGARSYLGIDQMPGPGVDRVMRAETMGWTDYFDLVICTEMLEHAQNWDAAVIAMKRALKVGGHLILTTRGPGAGYHAYPEDWWRFTPLDIARAFNDFAQVSLEDDPDSPGVFFAGQRRDPLPTWPYFTVQRAPQA